MATNTFTGATNNNWNNSLNWSLAAVPTAADGNVATFDALSPNCTVDGAPRVCNAIDFTNYTNTITMTNNITSSGNITLGAAMLIAGAGTLLANATATLTSNGKVWPNPMTLSGAVTYTLADNWNVDGLLTLGAGTSGTVVNAFQITASAGLTHGGSTSVISGTTNIILDGTGTITGPTSTGSFRNNLTINTAGTITIGTANPFRYNTGTLTYTAGTVVTTGSTLTVAAAATLAVAGIIWNNVTFQNAASTVTLSQNLNLTGTLTLGTSSTTGTIDGNQINAGGSISFGFTSGTMTGTAIVIATGTGTIDGPGVTSGRLNMTMHINTAGTITIATLATMPLNLLKYVAGTVITDAGTWTAIVAAAPPGHQST